MRESARAPIVKTLTIGFFKMVLTFVPLCAIINNVKRVEGLRKYVNPMSVVAFAKAFRGVLPFTPKAEGTQIFKRNFENPLDKIPNLCYNKYRKSREKDLKNEDCPHPTLVLRNF